eukprot:scaffold6007_cov183-Amphora_coffeaeformis.AAC.9
MKKRLFTKSLVVLLVPLTAAAISAFGGRKGFPFQLSRIRGGGGSSSYSDVEDDVGFDEDDNDTPDELLFPQPLEQQQQQDEEENIAIDAAAVLAMEREDPMASEIAGLAAPKRRRTSDIILNLIDETTGSGEEGATNSNNNNNQKELSDDLRLLMMERRDELIDDLAEQAAEEETKDSHDHHHSQHQHEHGPVGSMKRLLHFLAPKIPAIRHSPDVSLAIRSLPSDGDAGLAASLIATLAHLWEMQQLHIRSSGGIPAGSTSNATALVAAELVHDRRFEQLLETITCGVNVNQQKKEAMASKIHHHDDSNSDDDLVHLIQHSQIQDGLSIRDSCRAAWGIAMLGLHDVKVIGDINVHDLLTALSLRTRELLLGRVRLLCQDDFYVESNNSTNTMSVEERIIEIAQEIAEDTATAMWVFGCVQAVTGVKSTPLFHVCTSILCHDPFQLRNNVQEAIATMEEQPVVGGNDVIDKLDRAERIEDFESPSPLKKHHHERGEDIFLDWLSPTEVTDVLWAMAVYASKDATSMESITILSDIAVDRVVEWLAHDLRYGGVSVEMGSNDESPTMTQTETLDLDSQQSSTSQFVHDPENPEDDVEGSVANDTNVDDTAKDFDYVEVVDAAALLAQEHGQYAEKVEDIPMDDDQLMENLQREDVCSATVDSDFFIDENAEVLDPTLLVQAEEALDDSGPPDDQCSDPVRTYLSQKNTIDWLFSAHDLCSLSWAATELGDSLKSRTTQMVSDLLILMGPVHLARCSSADYSNLIWAVAKESNENSSPSTPNFNILGRWIAENVYRASGLQDAVIESDSWSLLRQLQPPELSRLLWSLASLSMTAEDKHLSSLVGVLSLAGLETASRNSHVFSTEDFARICWAFVEYSDYDAVLHTYPSSLVSLGRVLGLIDISLSSWEAGGAHPAPKMDEEGETEHAKEAFRFTSFFGRARSHITKFERKVEDMHDDLDDYPVQSLLAEKTRLPFLKDFPVDPATLCKLCGSLNRPGTKYSRVCDTHTMAKVILRLMTSRNGRLLQECHVSDLAALCVTAVSVTSSANRELVGLFSRRAVKVLNEHPSLLATAAPAILIKLIGALGDLGIKYHPEVDSRNAYRRLQLTARLPFSDDFAYNALSNESLKILVSDAFGTCNLVSFPIANPFC